MPTMPTLPTLPKLGGAFQLPTELRFGRGRRADLAAAVAGRRCWVIASARGRERWMADAVLGPALRGLDAAWIDDVRPNPLVEELEASIDRLRARGPAPDLLVAIGGGSVLDAAKAVAAALALPAGTALEALARRPADLDDRAPPPLIALPTTAGSGSEATSVAVLWRRRGADLGAAEGSAKVSLSHPSLFPVLGIVDPELTDALPPEVTLATGLDALNQAFESIWNRRAGPATLPLAVRAVELAWWALPALAVDPDRSKARDALAEASLLAGIALGQTRTAVCHALSYPLTDRFGLPHGVACAFTMPAVARHQLPADDGRLAEVARRLVGASATAAALPDALAAFLDGLGVAARVRSALGSREALLALLPEVELPERGGNALVDVDGPARHEIYRASWAGA
jgi:alcohol dehydrogenase